ncbi:MAG: hypothetical protein U0172_07195 [Nitrospiraceae bacterium]
MYDEPYRWVEAMGNRRQYLDDQFKKGSPLVGLSYADGVLLFSVSQGTPKLYEIYDRIGLGGMGHPADLEKLRFSLLEMAHVEGFNRSPADVTGSRLMKYALAPTIKQAFEELYKAPFIVKILLAELGTKAEKDTLLTIDYDGTFEERRGAACVAATKAIQQRMLETLQPFAPFTALSLSRAVEAAALAWGVGSSAQVGNHANTDDSVGESSASVDTQATGSPDRVTIVEHLRDAWRDRTIECAVLERTVSSSSKYRALTSAEIARLLPADFVSALPAPAAT